MRHIERAPLLVMGAIGLTFALVGADSCSGGGGGGGASTSALFTSTPSSSATAPAPQASSITGTIDPTSSIVGEPVTMTFDLSGFNRRYPICRSTPPVTCTTSTQSTASRSHSTAERPLRATRIRSRCPRTPAELSPKVREPR